MRGYWKLYAGPGSSQHGELTEPLLASVKDDLSNSLSPTREPSLAAPLQPTEAKVPQEAPQQLMLQQRWKPEVPFGKLSILLALLAGEGMAIKGCLGDACMAKRGLANSDIAMVDDGQREHVGHVIIVKASVAVLGLPERSLLQKSPL